MSAQEFKDNMTALLNHRIEYWENIVESHPNDFEGFDDIGDAWRAALQRGEEKGMLDGLYYAQEYLTGQRK